MHYKVFKNTDNERISAMLIANNLPTSDLSSSKIDFFDFQLENRVVGIFGIELYEPYGLLRSVVIDPAFRGKQWGQKMVKEAKVVAKNKGITQLFLLTTTAEEFFHLMGFNTIERSQAPLPVQNSAEFSSLCPDSAVVMKIVL